VKVAQRLVWMLILCAAASLAVGQRMQSQHTVDKAILLNLAPQPLQDALHQFSRDTGLNIMFLTDMVRGINSPHVSGTLTPEAALELLLKDAGLRFKYLDPKTIVVLPAREQQFDSDPRSMSRLDTDATRTASVDSGADGAASDSSAANDSNGDQPTHSRNGISAGARGKRLGDIDEVVVTAQKREEHLQNVPISVAVLSGKDLDKSTFAGVTDALNTVPGVTATPSYFGGGTQLAVRGVSGGSPAFGGSSPIAYYVDSVPFGFVRTAFVPDGNVYDLQRIEVLRGPQGTLYGASALNGVVRVLTEDADLNNFDVKVRGTDSSTVGGGNNYRGDVAINMPLIGGKLAARAVVGYENDSGWIDTPIKNDVNNAELRNFRLKINAEPTEVFSVGLSAWHTRDNYGAASTGDFHNFNSSLINAPITTEWDAYGIKINYQFPGFSVSSATGSLDYGNASYLDAVALLGFPFVVSSELRSNVFSQEMYLASTSESDWEWTAGAMYRHAVDSTWQENTFHSIGHPAIYTTLTANSKAVFGEVTRRFLSGRLELTAGLRHFHDSGSQDYIATPTSPVVPASSTSEANTPRFVLAWHPDDHATIYGSYSKGFRSGFPQTGGVNLPPLNLAPPKPDELTNYEVGAKGSLFGGRLAYDTAVYYMDWKDVQQSITVLLNGIPNLAVLNGATAKGPGVDVSVTTEPLVGLTLRANLGWNDLAFDSAVNSAGGVLFKRGDRPDFSPQTTASASVDYAFVLGRSGFHGRVSASGNYTSKQVYKLAGTTAGTGIGDDMFIARTSLEIDSPNHWRAAMFVDNLANTRDSPVIPPYSFSNWDVRVPPRTIGLQLAYHYK
jgi:iron complex outermembrane receptor protein